MCSVVQEIARQIRVGHFARERVDLRSAFSVPLKSPLLSQQDEFCHNV